MKEIVWVFGPSGAGKETFIRRINLPENKYLRISLGWKDKYVAACLESLEWVGKHRIKNDPVVAKRNQLISVIKEISARADVVLVKGQGVDLLADRPNELLAAEPMLRHRVIYLRVGLDELMRRLPNKPWWDGSDTSEDILNWINYELGMLQRVDPKIEVLAISSSANKKYEFVSIPKLLQARPSYSDGALLR